MQCLYLCSIVFVGGGNKGNQSVIMRERRNTTVCSFEPESPRISAFEIHEWIHDILRITEQKVNMIQIDGIRRKVYIKMVDIECVQYTGCNRRN